MNRRTLLITLGATAFAPRTVLAQAKQAPVLIGWLNTDSRDLSGHFLDAFKEGLAALGWKEGVQYVIEERWANGRKTAKALGLTLPQPLLMRVDRVIE